MISLLYCHNFASINAKPNIFDSTLEVKKVIGGIHYPVSMSFLGLNDIIILEKDTGYVKRIINEQIIEEPLLRMNVDNQSERGLLGSTVSHDSSGNVFVFLYFTKRTVSLNGTMNNITENDLFRYEFIDGKLVNPKLLFMVATEKYPIHNGGKMIVGPDNNLYVMIGDLFTFKKKLSANYPEGVIDGSGGILRLTLDGQPAKGVLSKYFPLNLYYAFGIRNGFGMDFDPITGNLWDTENGPNYADEINLVQPGFNSGWNKLQGIWKPYPEMGGNKGQMFTNFSQLVSFEGKGHYSPPEYIWENTIGVTSIKFLNSAKLGFEYENDMFIGDYKNGNIYHFDLSNNRTKVTDRYAAVQKDPINEDILIFNEKDFPECMKGFGCDIVYYNNTKKNLAVLIISTFLTSGNGSNIYGSDYEVIPKNEYKITTTMKMNNHTTQSNLKIEGYNNQTGLWEFVTDCFDNKNGPTEWTRYECTISIPDDISKIRPIVNGGYSNAMDKEAKSYFANIGIVDENEFVNLFPDLNHTGYVLFGKGFGHITDMQTSPDGTLYVLALLEANDPERSIADKNIREGVIYKITRSSTHP